MAPFRLRDFIFNRDPGFHCALVTEKIIFNRTSCDVAYSYPAPGTARPHAPTAIGAFTITNDADGNQVNTLGTGTSDQSEYLYENGLSCANKGPQAPSPSCNPASTCLTGDFGW